LLNTKKLGFVGESDVKSFRHVENCKSEKMGTLIPIKIQCIQIGWHVTKIVHILIQKWLLLFTNLTQKN